LSYNACMLVDVSAAVNASRDGVSTECLLSRAIP
jgi:hypothetical protein